MLDPLTFSLKMQHAAASSACCAAGIMAANWTRLLRGEQELVGTHHHHRRSDELHTHKDHIAKGASWTDHYGKRSHDIDVEHMR